MYSESLEDIKDDLVNKLKYYIDNGEYDKVIEINNLLRLLNEQEQSCVDKLKKIYEVH